MCSLRWRALRPPRVVFVLGFVSLINSLTSGKTLLYGAVSTIFIQVNLNLSARCDVGQNSPTRNSGHRTLSSVGKQGARLPCPACALSPNPTRNDNDTSHHTTPHAIHMTARTGTSLDPLLCVLCASKALLPIKLLVQLECRKPAHCGLLRTLRLRCEHRHAARARATQRRRSVLRRSPPLRRRRLQAARHAARDAGQLPRVPPAGNHTTTVEQIKQPRRRAADAAAQQ